MSNIETHEREKQNHPHRQSGAPPGLVVRTRSGDGPVESAFEKPMILPEPDENSPGLHLWADARFAVDIMAEHALFFALLISGVVLWFIASIPRELQVIRYVAVLVHAIAALATIGGIIVHIYMGIAVVPDGLHAILHGDVSEQWARHHHALWAAQAPRIQTSGTHADRDA